MKIENMYAMADIERTIRISDLSFTEKAIVYEILRRSIKSAVIRVNEYKKFIEKEIDIVTGEEKK